MSAPDQDASTDNISADKPDPSHTQPSTQESITDQLLQHATTSPTLSTTQSIGTTYTALTESSDSALSLTSPHTDSHTDPTTHTTSATTTKSAKPRQRAHKRKTTELTDKERWYCPNHGCNKIFKRTSSISINAHKQQCQYARYGAGTNAVSSKQPSLATSVTPALAIQPPPLYAFNVPNSSNDSLPQSGPLPQRDVLQQFPPGDNEYRRHTAPQLMQQHPYQQRQVSSQQPLTPIQLQQYSASGVPTVLRQSSTTSQTPPMQPPPPMNTIPTISYKPTVDLLTQLLHNHTPEQLQQIIQEKLDAIEAAKKQYE